MKKLTKDGVLPRSKIEVRLPPGTAAPRSGIYEEVGPRGGQKDRQAVAVAGKALPPTKKAGHQWTLVKSTNSKK